MGKVKTPRLKPFGHDVSEFRVYREDDDPDFWWVGHAVDGMETRIASMMRRDVAAFLLAKLQAEPPEAPR